MKYGLFLNVAILLVSQLACSAETASAQKGPLTDKAREGLTAWFAKPEADRGDIPEACQKVDDFSAEQVKVLQDVVWDAYKQGAIALGWESDLPKLLPPLEEIKKMKPEERPRLPRCHMESRGKEMPFFLLSKGQRGENGWPAYISLHGGGRCPEPKKMTDPHGWDVNDREWQTQLGLFQMVFEPDGIYFLPRMADDRDGRWWFNYCQEIYEDLIRRLVLFYDVDPNRVYLMGISEGGYGVYMLAPFMADRFAAVGAMAAGAGGTSENLRDLPFRTDVGENDNQFGRAKMAREFHEKLDKLQKKDPDGYVNHLEAQKGKGHGIDYGQSPKWLQQFTRNPWPEKIVWTVKEMHGRHKHQMYWLGYENAPAAKNETFRFTAKIDREKNTVYVTAQNEKMVTLDEKDEKGKPKKEKKILPFKDNSIDIYLNDTLLNLDKPVTVIYNDKEIFKKKVPRTLENMMQTLDQRGDPNYIFPARIHLEF